MKNSLKKMLSGDENTHWFLKWLCVRHHLKEQRKIVKSLEDDKKQLLKQIDNLNRKFDKSVTKEAFKELKKDDLRKRVIKENESLKAIVKDLRAENGWLTLGFKTKA